MSRAGTRKTKSGQVRIIGGTWRRRRIAVPPGTDLRPTPDRVRETLFNWLSPALPGAECLDLFAGTGVLGFEALSRGAGRVVMIEQDPDHAEALGRVCRELRASAEIICMDALQYLARVGDRRPDSASVDIASIDIASIDIVFVDPPYTDAAEPVLESIMPILKPGALVYLERARGGPWPESPGLIWRRRASAGDVDYGLAELGN